MIWLLSPIAPSNLFDVEVEVSNGLAAIEDFVVSIILFVEVEMDWKEFENRLWENWGRINPKEDLEKLNKVSEVELINEEDVVDVVFIFEPTNRKVKSYIRKGFKKYIYGKFYTGGSRSARVIFHIQFFYFLLQRV